MLVLPAQPVIASKIFNDDNNICDGDQNATLDLFVEGGSGNYGYNYFESILSQNVFASSTTGTLPWTGLAENRKYGIVVYDLSDVSKSKCNDTIQHVFKDISPVILDASITDSTLCKGDSVNLYVDVSGSRGIASYEYVWSEYINGVKTVLTPQPIVPFYKTVMPDTTTRYSIEIKTQCDILNVNSAVYIRDFRETEFTIEADTFFCIGEDVNIQVNNLKTTDSVNWPNFTDSYTFQWTPDLGSNKSVILTNVVTDTVVEVEVTNSCAQIAIKQKEIRVVPSIALKADTTHVGVCLPLDILFDLSLVDHAGNAFTSGRFNNATWVINGVANTTSGSQFNFTNSGFQEVNVMTNVIFQHPQDASLTRTCPIDTLFEFSLEENPLADFYILPQAVVKSNEEVTFQNTSSFASRYNWHIQSKENVKVNRTDLSDVHYKLPSSILQIDSVSYDVLLTALNTKGCVDSLIKRVTVLPSKFIYVPNAFTPNGDGNNDVFIPSVTNYDKSTLLFRVYDRWGLEVYHGEGEYVGWNGVFDGGKAPIDTYIYKLTVDDYEGESYKFVGHVTLVR